MPERLVLCGLLFALSFTVKVPLADPVAVGLNTMLKLQVLPLGSVVPQVFDDTAKGPVIVKLMPVSVVGRLFLRFTFLGALVLPTFVLGNVRLEGIRLACGTPVPVIRTVWGLPGTLSKTFSVADSAVSDVGVKLT